MDVQSMLRGAGSVLVVGILMMLIGVLVPKEWDVAELFRGVGVIVTFMGMIGMVALRQSATDERLLPRTQEGQHHPES
jgi:hypothetical protein